MRSVLLIGFVLFACLAFGQNNSFTEMTGKNPETKGNEETNGRLKGQKDSVVVLQFTSYSINENNHKQSIALDTALDRSHIYTPLQRKSPSWTRGTSYGLGALNNEYFKRSSKTDFIFWQPYEAYWTPNEDIAYYSLNTPFTDIYFTRAQKSSGYEQRVGVLHARNFSPNLNIALKYNVISTPGIQGHQNGSRHTNFTAQANYVGLRYQLHANVTRTQIENDQSGGYVNTDGGIDDLYFHVDSVAPRLASATDKLYRLAIYADQEYLIGPKDSVVYKDRPTEVKVKAWASLRHRVKYERYYRYYADEDIEYYTDANKREKLSFYGGAFYNSNETFDSVYFHQLTNHAEIEIKEGFVPNVNFGLRAGLRHELNKVYNFQDYVYTGLNEENYHSFAFTATIFNRVSDYWAWQANGNLYLDGYKKDDLKLNGELTRYFFVQNDSSILNMKAEYSRTRPNYFINKYYSNHYIWVNNFDKTEKISGSLNYNNPKWRFEVGMNAEQIKNYVYLDQAGMPQQSVDFLIWSVHLSKSFRFGNFGFDNYITYQYSGNDQALRIPSFITSHSLFFDRSFFKDAIRLQIGVDFRMTDKYYADYFNPATGLFQLQDEQEIGLFPVVDAFVNMRVRNARLFFKFCNLYQNYGEEWFYTAGKTIDAPSVFRLGVYWYFKD